MDRLISENKVLEAIDNLKANFTCYDSVTLDEVASHVKAIPPAEPKTEWIPVSEKLPEKNVEVLATTEWGAVTIAEMYSANDWFIHEGTTNAEADEIVAWMPLPKPFKPQESEG